MDIFKELKNEKNNTDFEDVPAGTYEVEIEKLEMGKTKKGDEKIETWFKIVGSDYDGRFKFYNQVIKTAYTLRIAKDHFEKLYNRNIELNSWDDLHELVPEVYSYAKDYTYKLDYDNSGKWATYIITEQFGGQDVWES